MKQVTTIMLAILLVCGVAGCKKDKPSANNPPAVTPTTEVKGYGMLSKITGIWRGNVISSTAIGSFPEYTADYRPISASQVSAKNELDKNNDLFMSFFITWHCDSYKLAFRNGGYFSGLQRISYLVMDSVFESSSSSFYRFVDFKAGKTRTYADLLFRADSLYMKVYTNKNRTLPQAVMHFEWNAGLQNSAAAQPAIQAFNFPQKTLVKDLCNAFNGKEESIFYDASQDVYPEAQQPYLGKTTIQATLNSLPTAGKKVYFIITPSPLFNGFVFQPAVLNSKSRYVAVEAASPQFVFNYMHPGTYYIYALYDADGNGTFSTGDYTAVNGTDLNRSFTLSAKEEKTVTVNLNFMIP